MLGLYIFGKSFAQVKRFIDSKTIGDIQSFYYTKFYKSEDHKRWKEYKKARKEYIGKKSVYRQTLFTTPTHQYLLSRLLNNDSVEWCIKLLQEYKNFQENKLSLEDYVIALKNLVGLEALIKVVGIGKEDDLSNLTEDSMKSIYAIHEEKDFSKLTYSEIIHILIGDSQISKSRANDLFQEAIWPHLLAKGWHSDQRGSNHDTLSYKSTTTIFIVPIVEEFSSKLVNGIHYFDSVNDLLAEVVSHPELLKDLASQNGSNESNSSGVSSDTANSLPKDVSLKGTTFEINLPIVIEKVEGDETIVNDVAEIKLEDHENQLSNRDVKSLRKSRRPSKPSTKALEVVVDKYEEETNCRRRRDVETLRKSRRPAKPSMKALEAVVDKCEEEGTSCERRRDVETLRKSRRPPKPSTKALEAVVDKYEEEETSCKRRQDVESLRKSRRSPKPSTKTVEAVVDKYEEEASRKRRRV
ncbi:arginine-glutamic acid dipeptide repeat protein [Trifolium repens]|nr:arginine-glutamic acid dipeptide repeat protein [Trifolium repens]